MRSPVTLVINAFNALTEDEKKLCLDFIAPEPEPEPAAKQTRKKRTRAPRTGLPDAAKDSKANANSNGGSESADETAAPNCGICGNPPIHPDHDRTYIKSHDFEPPKSVASATRRASRKGAAASSTPSTETNSEGALAVGASGA